jgi:hypothetical protein
LTRQAGPHGGIHRHVDILNQEFPGRGVCDVGLYNGELSECRQALRAFDKMHFFALHGALRNIVPRNVHSAGKSGTLAKEPPIMGVNRGGVSGVMQLRVSTERNLSS